MKQLTLIALLFFTISYGQHINLMTYNIRYDNPKDGENAWPNRKETLLNQITVLSARYNGNTGRSGASDQLFG